MRFLLLLVSKTVVRNLLTTGQKAEINTTLTSKVLHNFKRMFTETNFIAKKEYTKNN